MNNLQFYSLKNKELSLVSKSILCLLLLLTFSDITPAQNGVWRYVTTVAGGAKIYVNDEQGSAIGRSKLRWEKAINEDGSFAIALTEWNCGKKRCINRQITFYNSDQTVVGTKKNEFNWTQSFPTRRLICFFAACV